MLQQGCVHLFEEHSSTLPIWWAQHARAQTVVYLDAHLDLQKTSDEAIAALKRCTRLEHVQALEAPDHLNRSARYAFGIENFLYAGQQLNLIDRLIWVAPPHIPRQYSTALIDYTQQMDGISFDELTSFEEIGRNAVRGTLLGLDITICDYDALASLGIDGDFYLDVDIDYFVDVPSDRLWIDPATVINAIMAQLGEPQLVTISRAVTSGFTPLAFRFVADYIYSLLTGQEGEFDYYQQLTSAILDMSNGNLHSGHATCQQLISDWPDLAPAYYILALCTGDRDRKNLLLDAASGCDSAYRFDLAREMFGLLHRKKNPTVETLRSLAIAFDNLELEGLKRAQTEVAYAQILAATGNLVAAQDLIARQSGDYAQHEEVLLSVSAKQLADPTKREQNKKMLACVADGMTYRTIANVYLGDLESADKNYQAALEHYQTAHQLAPAWIIPLQRMLAACDELDLREKASGIEKTIAYRQQCLEQLASKGRGQGV